MDFLLNLNWLKMFEILIPALISIVSIFFARFLEKQKAIELEIREKKIKIYGEITKLIFEDIMGNASKNKPIHYSIIAKYPKLCNDLIFWGSDKVVKQYQRTFQSFRTENNLKMMDELEKLLLAIRKDTGHKNKGFKKFDLIKVFIKDADEIVDGEKMAKNINQKSG